MEPQNREVGQKLGLATLLMFTAPVVTYFVAEGFLFSHKQNPDVWAGISAVIVTNVIVGVYCWSAFSEPDDDFDETRGTAPPRVGVFKMVKERTD